MCSASESGHNLTLAWSYVAAGHTAGSVALADIFSSRVKRLAGSTKRPIEAIVLLQLAQISIRIL